LVVGVKTVWQLNLAFVPSRTDASWGSTFNTGKSAVKKSGLTHYKTSVTETNNSDDLLGAITSMGELMSDPPPRTGEDMMQKYLPSSNFFGEPEGDPRYLS